MIKVYWLYHNETDNIFVDGYVGITKNKNTRFAQHREKFGEFKFKIIFYGTIEQALSLEYMLRPKPGIGWNRAIGGKEGYKLGHCEETVKIIKEKRKLQIAPRLGMKHRPETIERIRSSNLGLKRSNETIAKMKIAKQNISAETRAKTSAASIGRKHTLATKSKVIAALIGRPVSEETRNKIRIANTGRVISKEKRENMINGKWNKYNLDMSNVMILKQ